MSESFVLQEGKAEGKERDDCLSSNRLLVPRLSTHCLRHLKKNPDLFNKKYAHPTNLHSEESKLFHIFSTLCPIYSSVFIAGLKVCYVE